MTGSVVATLRQHYLTSSALSLPAWSRCSGRILAAHSAALLNDGHIHIAAVVRVLKWPLLEVGKKPAEEEGNHRQNCHQQHQDIRTGHFVQLHFCSLSPNCSVLGGNV